jgi:hypothetical protein
VEEKCNLLIKVSNNDTHDGGDGAYGSDFDSTSREKTQESLSLQIIRIISYNWLMVSLDGQ